MLRIIVLHYLFPVIVQLLVSLLVAYYFVAIQELLLFMKSILIGWAAVFTVIRTIVWVFLRDDLLVTCTGFIVSNAVFYTSFKTSHWPGKEMFLSGIVVCLVFGITALALRKR